MEITAEKPKEFVCPECELTNHFGIEIRKDNYVVVCSSCRALIAEITKKEARDLGYYTGVDIKADIIKKIVAKKVEAKKECPQCGHKLN